jgi:magnesium-transporting ATPase (P-type)
MITGDGALTAAAVARRVGMLHAPPRQTLVLSARRTSRDGGGGGGGSALAWRPLVGGFEGHGSSSSSSSSSEDLGAEVPFDPRQCAALVAAGQELVVTGDALAHLLGAASAAANDAAAAAGTAATAAITAAASPGSSDAALHALCSHAAVFARVAPAHKAAVVAALNGAGHFTLMCGDGTSRIGFQAHVS